MYNHKLHRQPIERVNTNKKYNVFVEWSYSAVSVLVFFFSISAFTSVSAAKNMKVEVERFVPLKSICSS